MCTIENINNKFNSKCANNDIDIWSMFGCYMIPHFVKCKNCLKYKYEFK